MDKIVIPIILVFMIDLNQKLTILKNQIDRKNQQKRSIYSLIDDRSFYLRSIIDFLLNCDHR